MFLTTQKEKERGKEETTPSSILIHLIINGTKNLPLNFNY